MMLKENLKVLLLDINIVLIDTTNYKDKIDFNNTDKYVFYTSNFEIII